MMVLSGFMPVFDSYPQGTPCFVDLVTPDLPAAAAFYGALFGWTYGQRPASESDSYRVATVDGHVVAGLDGDMPPMAGHPAFWRVYLAVDDIDAAVGQVPGLGGVVESGPDRQGDREATAAIKDPTGVRVGLWQAGSVVGTELANEPGTPIWNELVSADLPAATSFYADLLGISWDEVQTPGGLLSGSERRRPQCGRGGAVAGGATAAALERVLQRPRLRRCARHGRRPRRQRHDASVRPRGCGANGLRARPAGRHVRGLAEPSGVLVLVDERTYRRLADSC